MNISYNWLKDLVEMTLTPQETAEKLTSVGLAVEAIHPHGDDFVFDIDLTSNRGDCLSHKGIARELSAVADCPLKSNWKSFEEKGQAANLVTISAPDLCHRFTARVIRNVKIGPSPEWLVNRLEAIGQRSVNNVADITNYVMFELGNPMHAFDLSNLAENRIVVRRAEEGEMITTLDEVERKLSNEMLLICDAEKPIAVGGVMGGLGSSISDATTDVLLEVAYFKRDSIRQTSRSLKLSTEASHRFERGIDIENLIRASNRATELIIELAGGEAGEFLDLYPTVQSPVFAPLRHAKIEALTGLKVTEQESERILEKLGFGLETDSDGTKTYRVPTWRHDVSIEPDLVEEIARHVGFHNIAEELPPAFGAGEYQPNEPRKKALRRALAQLGYDEAISYSFIDTKHDDTFELIPNLADAKLNEKFVTLQDSIIEGAVRMRATLLPSLLDAVRSNFNYQTRNVRLFELGKVFAESSDDSLPREQELLAIVMTGGETLEGRAAIARELDFYDLRGALEHAITALGISGVSFEAAQVRHLRKGQSAEVKYNGRVVGYLGRINDDLAAGYKFRQPVFVAEVDLQSLLAQDTAAVFYQPLPKFPTVQRDVSLLVKRELSFSRVLQTVESLGFELCRKVSFVDAYEGKGVADDERSLTIRLEYRSDERTLVDADVEEIHGKILAAVDAQLGAKHRF
jgi:phenylalanyl-tRNA synthetase beta chain